MNPASRSVRAAIRVAAACAALLPALPATAQDVGRLFFTPQQRQELDRRRANNVADEAGPVVESSVTVNGQVTRSSGKTTTWINGVPQYDTYRGKAPDRVAVESGDTASRSGKRWSAAAARSRTRCRAAPSA
jgi:hypothetical protein